VKEWLRERGTSSTIMEDDWSVTKEEVPEGTPGREPVTIAK